MRAMLSSRGRRVQRRLLHGRAAPVCDTKPTITIENVARSSGPLGYGSAVLALCLITLVAKEDR